MTTKKIFMSYSRREIGFVDDVVSKLEEKKYEVWLDYRVLIPGTPWAEQIDKGLKESDTVLLVVSKASLASDYVALEWRHFLETNKRVLLLIFEAVDLPTELEKYEWIDFRGSYSAGLKELFSQLEKPIQEEHPVPETGFKIPANVLMTIGLSIFVALISLVTFWTIFIPFTLIPLPFNIWKRSFEFSRVQMALLALPFALLLSSMVYFDEDTDFVAFIVGMLGWLLLAVLRSGVMQRWGKPEATVPKFKNPIRPNIMNPEPISFFVDHAPEDASVAKELTTVLTQYKHPQVDDIKNAKTVFSLISRFKSDSEAVPASQMVFPILIQDNANISKKLSKLQWIDFRAGVKGLNAIAQLLPNPTGLLKALGIRPISALKVFPPMITTLYYFIILITVVSIGGAFDYLFFSGILPKLDDELNIIVSSSLVVGNLFLIVLTYFMLSGLTMRTGFFSKFSRILIGIGLQGFTLFLMFLLDVYIYDLSLEYGFEIGFTFTFFGMPIFIIGIVLLLFVHLRNPRDIRLWFRK